MIGVEERVKLFLETWAKRKAGEIPAENARCVVCGVLLRDGGFALVDGRLLCVKCKEHLSQSKGGETNEGKRDNPGGVEQIANEKIEPLTPKQGAHYSRGRWSQEEDPCDVCQPGSVVGGNKRDRSEFGSEPTWKEVIVLRGASE